MSEPPYNHEIEKAVIASCLFDAEKITDLTEADITPEHFHDARCRLIWSVIPTVIQERGAADMVTLMEYLRTTSMNDSQMRNSITAIQREMTMLDYISMQEFLTITSCIESTASFPVWVDSLRELFRARSFVAHLKSQIEAVEQTPREVQERIEETATWLVNQNAQQETTLQPMEVVAHEAWDEMERERNNDNPVGLSTGYLDLDSFFRLMPGQLTILAARPAMGKSALALNIANHVAANRTGVLFFTLEMSNVELGKRAIATHGRVNVKAYVDGESHLRPEEMQARAESTARLPIWLEEAVPMRVSRIRATARRMCLRHNIGLIVIDYLQLAEADNPRLPREQAIGEISRNCKLMAKELRVPVLALSQLNREVEKREPPRPKLSDLRDSGTIEQDADNVMFISPTLKNNETDKWVAGGRMILDVAKNRHGPNESVNLTYVPTLTRFENHISEQA